MRSRSTSSAAGVALLAGQLGRAQPGLDRLLRLASVRVRIAELFERRPVARVLHQDRVQVLDRLRALSVAQVDARLGEQLLGVAVGRRLRVGLRLRATACLGPRLEHGLLGDAASRRLRAAPAWAKASLRGRRLRRLLEQVFAEAIVEELVVDQRAFVGERRLAIEQHLAARGDAGADRERVGRGEALDDLPRVLLVAAPSVEIREPAIDVLERVLALLRAVDVGEQLVVFGLRGVRVEQALRIRLGALAEAAREQVLREHLHRRRAVRLELEDALEHGAHRLRHTLALQLGGDLFVLVDRLREELLLAQQVRDLQPAGGVGRIECRHLA